MKNRGFTLIEIIVAMAILSIMAGTLVPMMYQVWENNAVSLTQERMLELKKAMVGDRALVQQGIRSHYGFVGDNGQLPSSLDDLVTNSGAWANWNGPYLGGNNLDAWKNAVIYTPVNVSGINISATLLSYGPDGKEGGDDVSLHILEGDVCPTDRVQGNLNYTFTSNSTQAAPSAVRLVAKYPTKTGTAEVVTNCVVLPTAGDVQPGEPKVVAQFVDDDFGITLPVGPVVVRSRLFRDANCMIELGDTSEISVFISDGQSKIYVNPPTLYYPIPEP
jgi:general secretion pathway protein G